jgi:hypothetical protein
VFLGESSHLGRATWLIPYIKTKMSDNTILSDIFFRRRVRRLEASQLAESAAPVCAQT